MLSFLYQEPMRPTSRYWGETFSPGPAVCSMRFPVATSIDTIWDVMSWPSPKVSATGIS